MKTIATLIAALLMTGAAAAELKLGLPIDCVIGKSCFVQNYMDMDPGPAYQDPGCGIATYDGHKGTDIRLRSLKEMVAGVDVLAMADGKIIRLRDGQPDRLVLKPQDRQKIKGRECGNGLTIDHGDGWTSQYCHMMRQSLVVRIGDTVSKGEKLAQIGISGLTQFPHVHVTVRWFGKLVDPMTGGMVGGGCLAQRQLPESTLWDRQTARRLTLIGTAMLEIGFAKRPVSAQQIMSGVTPKLPDRNSTSFVLWTRLINLRKGDRIGFRVDGPSGTMVKNTIQPFERSQASWIGFAGRPQAIMAPGRYRGEVAIIRDRKIVLYRKVELTIQPR